MPNKSSAPRASIAGRGSGVLAVAVAALLASTIPGSSVAQVRQQAPEQLSAQSLAATYGSKKGSKARNVNLGHRDSTRKWDPYITVTLADGSEYPYRGLVDFADPQVDPQTGTFSVRAEMANPDHILLPGQFTKVRLLLDVREDAVVVPSKAIEIEKGGAYIYVVRPDSIVEKRFVETGPEWGNNIVVERGLVRGEDIVVEGYHKLQHGMKVEPVAPRRDEEAEKQQ